MDAFGMDLVTTFAVGVGQSEVDIVKKCILHWCVNSVPDLGDDIQANKGVS